MPCDLSDIRVYCFIFRSARVLVGRQQHQNLFQARTTLPSTNPTIPGHRAQAPPLRAAPAARTLSGILGAGARRREDVGATRTFSTFSSSSSSSGSSAGNGTSTVQAKPLRPSALRASGRTTVLSSHAHPSASAGRSRGAGPGAGPRAGSGVASRGSEDLLKLPWAYGSSMISSGSEQRSASVDAPSVRGANEGPGGVKRQEKTKNTCSVSGEGAATNRKKKAGQGALGKAAEPPREAHPAGYTNGSVVVPAESPVFSQMPQRFPMRSDGSRTNDSAKMVADAQVCVLFIYLFLSTKKRWSTC